MYGRGTILPYHVEAEIIPHPPYSPDLSLCDFALFPRSKRELRGKRFEDLGELRSALNNILSSFTCQWSRSVFQSWVQRHEKCIVANEEYFEKL